jgi:G3E family GTPase
MVKVDIISGFLGAGKTTLIKELLTDALSGQRVVLIENEFGEIGIDGGFLKDAGIQIREMNSGCICCSLVGDFGRALKEVTEKYHPDRVIIEPSGVGKLSDVIHAIEGAAEDAGLEINSATTVVDVLKCKMYLKNFGEFFKNQVESAGTVILSRTDVEKATQEKVEEALNLLRPLNPDATIITTPVTELGGKKVLETIEGVKIDLTKIPEEEHHHHHDHDGHDEHDHHDHDHDHHDHDHDHDDHDHDHNDHDHDHDDHDHDHHDHDHDHEHHDHDSCGCGHDHHHHHHDADEVFTSWGQETIRKYTKEEIHSILEALSDEEKYGTVLRAKGMVAGADGSWIYFDMVPGEADVREGSPEYTGRLCVIGAQMKEDKLAELFGLTK